MQTIASPPQKWVAFTPHGGKGNFGEHWEAVSTATLIAIYALTDPDTGEVRYVGQTKDPWKRYGSHLAAMGGTKAKQAWFLDLQQRQRFPVLKILEEAVIPRHAAARERWRTDQGLPPNLAEVERGKETREIAAKIVDLDTIILGEFHENAMRKDFTISERVAIGKAIEAYLGDRQGQRTDQELVPNWAQVEPG